MIANDFNVAKVYKRAQMVSYESSRDCSKTKKYAEAMRYSCLLMDVFLESFYSKITASS